MTHHTNYPDRSYLVYRIGKDIDETHFRQGLETSKKLYKMFDSVEQCIAEIFSLKDYQDLPRSINIDYIHFQGKEVPLEEIISALRTAVALTSSRLGYGYQTVKINFRIAQPISKSFSEYLESIGVDNLTPTPSHWGTDVWKSAVDRIVLSEKVWPKFLIEGNEALNICHIESTQISFKLTPRQEEIVRLIAARGLSNKQVARQLGISESAIKLHVGLVLKKYGLRNRTQLARALTNDIST